MDLKNSAGYLLLLTLFSIQCCSGMTHRDPVVISTCWQKYTISLPSCKVRWKVWTCKILLVGFLTSVLLKCSLMSALSLCSIWVCMLSDDPIFLLTHLPLVPHICISESGWHWFRKCLVVYSAPSHYLKQCWNIVDWTLRNKLQWYFNWNSYIFIEKNAFECVNSEMAAISSGRDD